MKVSIVGASGYSGLVLLRLVLGHSELELENIYSNSKHGKSVNELTNSHLFDENLVFSPLNIEELSGLDVVFFSTPHGVSQQIIPQIKASVGQIIDLSADFRLKDRKIYEAFYGEHKCFEIANDFVFGLPEIYRNSLIGAKNIAVAGCYVTASSLALYPFVKDGWVEREVIVDAASGVSGAGSSLSERTHFVNVADNYIAYSVASHRHVPEMEQVLSSKVVFTPHLAPFSRGILATCYARLAKKLNTKDALEVLGEFYEKSPFVKVSDSLPNLKLTIGTNECQISARIDENTGYLISISAIDNLTKGAASQAIQCLNISQGFEESCGLNLFPILP